MLIALGGLPATGKTTLARLLSGLTRHPVGPVGYVVGYALAEEHLRGGLTVVAESVNPLAVTRDAWRDTAVRAGVPVLEVEVVCSDPGEHRRRVAERSVDIPELPFPGWEEVVGREYEPWHRPQFVLDTAGQEAEESLGLLLDAVLTAGRG
ncbi:adenylyl-sulfate kinase [Streptomyces sp. NPDC047072]|uniref:AAA family ATPase n=1 Tax=Streptomyces sp. NPDC047072 TaxID=3154809 RepID=UPI0033F9D1ED